MYAREVSPDFLTLRGRCYSSYLQRQTWANIGIGSPAFVAGACAVALSPTLFLPSRPKNKRNMTHMLHWVLSAVVKVLHISCRNYGVCGGKRRILSACPFGLDRQHSTPAGLDAGCFQAPTREGCATRLRALCPGATVGSNIKDEPSTTIGAKVAAN